MAVRQVEKRERAYQMWARLPDKTNPHAMVKLSQDLGIARQTIYDWRDEDGWLDRWLKEVFAVAPETIEQGGAILTQAWPMVAGRLVSIIQNGSNKDAINAIKVYADIIGAKKVELFEGDDEPKGRVSQQTIEQVKALPREALWGVAVEQGNQNMERSLTRKRNQRN